MCPEEKRDELGLDTLTVEQAEKIFRELYSTLEKTVGPWSTGRIFACGPDEFDEERPVEMIQEVINNMAKMLGIKTAKKLTLMALESLQKGKLK